MNEHPTASAAPDLAGALPRPWGFWSTLSIAVVAFAFAQFVGLVWWMSSAHTGDAVSEALGDPAIPLLLIITNVMLILALAGAARLAGWSVGEYLGFVWPRRRDIAAVIAALVAVMVVLEIITYLSGRATVTPFQTDAYRAAKAAGMLPVMWLSFVLAAPAGEEVLFRGFIFRGWAASSIGLFLLKGDQTFLRGFLLRGWTALELSALGTIILTAMLFAAVHVQYDWFGIFQVFCLGTLFGWARWRSGSTTLTILLHMAINLVSMVWTTAKVEGWV